MDPTPPPAEPKEPTNPAAAPTPPPAPEPPVAPAAPVAPVVQPAPTPQPPKKKLSKGALIAIIAGSVIGFLVIFGLLLAIAITSYNRISEKAKSAVNASQSNGSSKADGTTTSYEADHFSFSYPSNWTQSNKDNQTTIIGGVKPDGYKVITTPDKDKSAIVTYTYNKGSTQLIDKERARAAMKTAVETQKNATQSQLLSYRESSGHGCTSNVKYTDEPTYKEKGDLIGYTYGYTCNSFYGPVQGVYGVWYDQYGGQQRLLVSALAPYWNDNSDTLESILTSATAK